MLRTLLISFERTLNIALMKKLLSYAVLTLVGAFVLVGCKKEETVVVPTMTNSVPTNAPANP